MFATINFRTIDLHSCLTVCNFFSSYIGLKLSLSRQEVKYFEGDGGKICKGQEMDQKEANVLTLATLL
jgi:hypothetical protein